MLRCFLSGRTGVNSAEVGWQPDVASFAHPSELLAHPLVLPLPHSPAGVDRGGEAHRPYSTVHRHISLARWPLPPGLLGAGEGQLLQGVGGGAASSAKCWVWGAGAAPLLFKQYKLLLNLASEAKADQGRQAVTRFPASASPMP